LEKFDELKKEFDEGIWNRLPPGTKKKAVSWLERLDIGNYDHRMRLTY